MRQARQVSTLTALLGVIASLFVVLSAGAAQAAESIPDLQYPAITLPTYYSWQPVAGPSGEVTMPCNGVGSDLTTYDDSGQVIRQISHTDTIDDVANCIRFPVADKSGDVYGVPTDSTNSTFGPNLLAYSGNTLKWKHSVCSSNTAYAVGANGNIYFMDSDHLRGLTPDVESGQTQPTSVLDVDTNLTTPCSRKLISYKDGLVLQNDSTNVYYSYSGKYLGKVDVSVGTPPSTRINDEGSLFVISGDGGSTPRVTKYDALTHIEAWHYTFSSGASISGRMRPLPGGGVVAAATQSGSTSLVIVDNQGQYVRSAALPSEDGDDDGTTILVDGNEKVVVLRMLSTYDGTNALSVRVYDIQSDDWTYATTLKGDPTKSGGPSFFYWEAGMGDEALGSETFFMTATCTGNCVHDTKLYPIKLTDVGAAYPRSTVLAANTPTQPAPVSYVALGDSFSAGEGNSPYLSGTDDSGFDMCHRSTVAYPILLGHDPNTSLSLDYFVACSGAKTVDILNSNTSNVEPPQVDALSSDTDIVTMTMGGNDIGFAGVLTTCLEQSEANCLAAGQDFSDKAGSSTQQTAWQSSYQSIRSSVSSGTEILIIGYPDVFPEPNQVQGACTWGDGLPPTTGDTISTTELNKFSDWTDDANSGLAAAVAAAGDSHLHFVDPTTEFSGHGICTTDPWFFNVVEHIDPSDQAGSYHPNREGQQGYASLISAYLANL